MQQEVISQKTVIITAFLCLSLTFIYFLINLLSSHTTTAICRSKTGVMVYMRLENRYDLLINPQIDSIFSCLGRYMPYYDRTIEGVIYLYPFKDIESNLKNIIQRYSIKNVYSDCSNKLTHLQEEFIRTVKINHCLSNKDELKVQNSTIQFLTLNQRFINLVRIVSADTKTFVVVFPMSELTSSLEEQILVDKNSNVIFLNKITTLEYIKNFIKIYTSKSIYAQTSVPFIPEIRDKVINLNKQENLSF